MTTLHPTTLAAALAFWSPIVATGTVLLTLVGCVVLTKARDVYVGGLAWPYFSDMGRDAPAYYLFAIGLTVVALTLAITWFFNGRCQGRLLSRHEKLLSATVRRLSSTAMTLAIISVIALPILGFFNTASYPDLHGYAAYAFFLLQVIAVTANTFVTYKIFIAAQQKQETGVVIGANRSSLQAVANEEAVHHKSSRRTFLLQLSTYVLFFIAVVLYLPVGLAIVQPFKHLTIRECLDRDLGETYCTRTMRLNTLETTLWNYENDRTANQMRAAAQVASIFTLVGYTLSFLSHDQDLFAPASGEDNYIAT